MRAIKNQITIPIATYQLQILHNSQWNVKMLNIYLFPVHYYVFNIGDLASVVFDFDCTLTWVVGFALCCLTLSSSHCFRRFFYSLPCLTIYATCFENWNVVDFIIVILFIEKYRKSENMWVKDFGGETWEKKTNCKIQA